MQENTAEPMAENSEERRPVAILAATVADTPQPCGGEGAAGPELLDAARGRLREAIAQAGGQVFHAAGEATLAEFPTVAAALTCALAVQNGRAGQTDGPPPQTPSIWRIGIHLGAMLQREGQLYGEGVHTATWLATRAEAGGITLSGAAYQQAAAGMEVPCDYLGRRRRQRKGEAVEIYQLLRRGISTPGGLLPARVRPEGRRLPGTPWVWLTGLALALLLASIAFRHWAG